jgi:hypothetical protein
MHGTNSSIYNLFEGMFALAMIGEGNLKNINSSTNLLKWSKLSPNAVWQLPIVAALFSSVVWAQQLPAHVHGAARLEVIAQGTELSVSLLSPLDNWVGFEHAPRNAAQKAAIEKVKSDVATKELIAFNPEALCKLKRADFVTGLPNKPLASEPAAVKKNEPSKAENLVKKAKPAESHSHKNKVEEHAESEASWEFHCEQPELLKELRLPLFKSYPRFVKIEAAAADSDGQSAATLTEKSSMLRLP